MCFARQSRRFTTNAKSWLLTIRRQSCFKVPDKYTCVYEKKTYQNQGCCGSNAYCSTWKIYHRNTNKPYVTIGPFRNGNYPSLNEITWYK